MEGTENKLNGWIIFYLYIIGMGSFLGLVLELVGLDIEAYEDYKWLASVVVLDYFFYAAFAVYTIYAVVKKKPDAIFLCKVTAIYLFLSNGLNLYAGEFDNEEVLGFSLNSSQRVITSFVWATFWVLYFFLSKQVNRIFPKEDRIVYKRDIVFTILLLLPTFILGVLIVAGKNMTTSPIIEIAEESLAENEKTDGLIAFVVPEDFSCKINDDEGVILFHLNKGTSDILICSLVNSEESEDVVNSWFRTMWDESMGGWKEEYLCDTVIVNDDRRTYHRFIRYSDQDDEYIPILWDAYILYDGETGKMAIVSNWYRSDELPCTEEIIHTIRFK